MPPRLPRFQCLRTPNGTSSVFTSRTFATTPSSSASTVAQRRRRRDPYAIAQARARKAANLSRQDVLKKERAAALGDPVRGTTTPFLQSFDTALPPEPSTQSLPTHTRIDNSPSESAPGPRAETDNHLNFFLSKDELAKGVERSKWFSSPIKSPADSAAAESSPKSTQRSDSTTYGWLSDFGSQRGRSSIFDDSDLPTMLTPEQRQRKLQADQDTASEALRRISSLSLGSSKDRLRVNVQRCVNVFGRHNTDQHLPAKATSAATGAHLEKTPRVGPDTGSSEVQIAILTAKIKTLADFLELRGAHDKANKRNLRLLVHRRAKLLRYLRKKERGGPRWQNLVETLGLTDGTWKDQITM